MSNEASDKEYGADKGVNLKFPSNFMTCCRKAVSCGVPRLGALLFLPLLVVGCVTTPTQQDRYESGEGIYFTENKSVDLDVREDFDAALRLLQDERYEQGIELLNKVIQGSHNNSAPYINIAMAYEKIGDMKRAEENFEKALEINPGHPVANNEYALLLRRTGRYAEARTHYETLLQKYPEFMPARKNLGVLCELYLDDAKCAIEQYEIYLNSFPEDETVKLWVAGLKQKLGQ